MIRRALFAVLAVSALAATGCGGDADEVAEVSAPIDATDDTRASSDVASDGEAPDGEAPEGEAGAAPTTVGPAGPVAPLTGLPGEVDRPALAVKIDNDPRSQPQSGVNQADVVLEEQVEGGLSRLVAIFHSDDADPVGPVRSARTSDVALLANLGGVYFANSGGNDGTLAAVRSSPHLFSVSQKAQPASYYRNTSRRPPYNLMTNTEALRQNAPAVDGRPPQLFTYRPAEEGPGPEATPATSATIAFGQSTTVRYDWDDAVGGWARTMYGQPHVDAEGARVAPTNVVILETAYAPSPADASSPEAQPTGTGTAWVLSEGTVTEGTWSRPTLADPAALTSSSGEPITLVPGTTWVAYPPAGGVTIS